MTHNRPTSESATATTKVTHREPHLPPSTLEQGYQQGPLTQKQPRPGKR